MGPCFGYYEFSQCVQAALTGARARREGTQERMTGSQGAEGQMRRDIGGLRLAMEQGLRECRRAQQIHSTI